MPDGRRLTVQRVGVQPVHTEDGRRYAARQQVEVPVVCVHGQERGALQLAVLPFLIAASLCAVSRSTHASDCLNRLHDMRLAWSRISGKNLMRNRHYSMVARMHGSVNKLACSDRVVLITKGQNGADKLDNLCLAWEPLVFDADEKERR